MTAKMCPAGLKNEQISKNVDDINALMSSKGICYIPLRGPQNFVPEGLSSSTNPVKIIGIQKL